MPPRRVPFSHRDVRRQPLRYRQDVTRCAVTSPPARPPSGAASPTTRSGWSSSPALPGLAIANEAEGGATAVAYNKISWNPKYQVINNLDYEVTQFLQRMASSPTIW